MESSPLWPTSTELYDVYTALDRLAVARMNLKNDRVDGGLFYPFQILLFDFDYALNFG